MNCPICASAEIRPLVTFKHYPVYLHPVPAGTVLEQIFVDLDYRFCDDCGHAFQADYDRGVLEKIYQNYYMSPEVPEIGASIRESFLDVYKPVRQQLGPNIQVLEIAAASGQMLADIESHFPDDTLTGFEPNQINAASARDRGFNLVNDFFTHKSAQDHQGRYDLIFCRHLIEHIFDMKDFFTGLDAVAKPTATLLLETPSLDVNLQNAALDPFHVEHIHVFSLHSLMTLGKLYGWTLSGSWTTAFGNVIAGFERQTEQAIDTVAFPETAAVDGIGQRIERWKKALSGYDANTNVILWGAGSYGLHALTLLDFKPSQIVDGNPNKAGSTFLGYDIEIVHAPAAIGALVASGKDAQSVVVIASSFYKKIQASLVELGWNGAIIALSDIE